MSALESRFTAAADASIAARAAGATGWLAKPFDPIRLVDVIRKVLG